MNLEQELDKLKITIQYKLKTTLIRGHYIVITIANIGTKHITYITKTIDIDELCSYIGVLLVNKVLYSL